VDEDRTKDSDSTKQQWNQDRDSKGLCHRSVTNILSCHAPRRRQAGGDKGGEDEEESGDEEGTPKGAAARSLRLSNAIAAFGLRLRSLGVCWVRSGR
jgi:hypothetical protein